MRTRRPLHRPPLWRRGRPRRLKRRRRRQRRRPCGQGQSCRAVGQKETRRRRHRRCRRRGSWPQRRRRTYHAHPWSLRCCHERCWCRYCCLCWCCQQTRHQPQWPSPRQKGCRRPPHQPHPPSRAVPRCRGARRRWLRQAAPSQRRGSCSSRSREGTAARRRRPAAGERSRGRGGRGDCTFAAPCTHAPRLDGQ